MKSENWPETITAKEFAAMADVTAERLGQLVSEGVFERVERGRYPFPAAVTAYFRHLRDAASRGFAANDSDRVRVARAREIEQRIARNDRDLVPKDEAIAAVDIMAGRFRSLMAGLPAQITRDHTERDRIVRIVDDNLAALATAFRQASALVQTGGDAADAVEEDDAGSMGEGE